MTKPVTPPIRRVLARITITADGCWEYPLLNHGGYGVIGEGPRNGRTLRTHRVTYTHYVGPIPEGTEIDHLCRNRACCNPNHLEAVVRSVNVLRGARKTRQTSCVNGHEFTPENTRTTDRQRICLACARKRSRESQRKRRAAERNAA